MRELREETTLELDLSDCIPVAGLDPLRQHVNFVFNTETHGLVRRPSGWLRRLEVLEVGWHPVAALRSGDLRRGTADMLRLVGINILD